jgi:hypothetical protein
MLVEVAMRAVYQQTIFLVLSRPLRTCLYDRGKSPINCYGHCSMILVLLVVAKTAQNSTSFSPRT